MTIIEPRARHRRPDMDLFSTRPPMVDEATSPHSHRAPGPATTGPVSRVKVILAVALAITTVALVLHFVVEAATGSSSSTMSSTATTSTPLGCAADGSSGAATCTFQALASRLCDVTLYAPTSYQETAQGYDTVAWYGPGINVYAFHTPNSLSFNCNNNNEGRSHHLTFNPAQAGMLTSAGPDDAAVEAILTGG